MGLIFLGFFLWFMFTIVDFVFSSPPAERKSLIDLWHSLGIRFNTLNGPEFGLSLGKLTGLLWMATGVITAYILKIELSFFATALVFLVPVWVGAFIWEHKNK